ncbi:homeobox-leucine zipper protein PROTODERMAL FACTOR 2-like [Cucurbita pepo subsp. pepo]|uniref:homeobox-leucine zipper protein PROTODERMAL FACTOR 2-like n=1 Tax=Cucurbita pepo subsp. pepo TaxID=3664 RepID=UPI000C9D80BA|nr:homeobox-leucine zipper protein PROTODERMAL FACTOR 2-like [Cucurbita pepo subsp. pepo]
MKHETETKLPKTEQLIHEPSVEQKYNQGEQYSPENGLSDPDMGSVVSPNIPNYSCSMDILSNDELGFLELQNLNNIMKAAYKEFMTIAVTANAWVFHPPVVGSVEDIQEMFHTPPPQGSIVECSVVSVVFPVTSRLLTSIMMDTERWASMFSNIICYGSEEAVVAPLKTLWTTDTLEVILVNAEFRLPAEYLPRGRIRFLRFKKMIVPDTWAIFDVSTDYFDDAISDPAQKIAYRRRPSGVIIRQRGFHCEAIWIENSVVQEIDIPKNICSTFTSNFPLTAEHWVSMLSQNLKRRRSKVVTSEMFDEIHGLPNLLVIGDSLRKVYIETVSPFPREKTWDLFSDDKVRILRDMNAHSSGYPNDYIASTTIYIPQTPLRLLTFMDTNNVKLQWLSIKSQAQLKTSVVFFSEDESNCISLRAKVDTGDGEVVEALEFFVQETSLDEYCSFVISSRMSEADVHLSLIPRFCKESLCLRPSGFAIMPAGPGGLQSNASLVTICIRRELENMKVDRVIEEMSGYMNAVVDQITHIQSPNVVEDDLNSEWNNTTTL